MKEVNSILIICGEGNYFEQAKQLVNDHQLENKVIFKGYIEPANLKEYTKNAYIGITLFTNEGKSNYLSMANRFFDYMHSCIPQLCMAYPEYVKVNKRYEISYLIPDTNVSTIANALNELLSNKELHTRLKENCIKAREEYCWRENKRKRYIVFIKICSPNHNSDSFLHGKQQRHPFYYSEHYDHDDNSTFICLVSFRHYSR